MSKRITDIQIRQLAQNNGWEYAALKAIIAVESGGAGFDPVTGKIIIQFEPNWFKREYDDWKKHSIGYTWFYNGVSNQKEEWKAFNSAFILDPDAAMQATSIGIMQVMGFHYRDIGFKTVGDMWDYAKESEANQIDLAIRFINNNPALVAAVKNTNWRMVAYYYNGSGYKKYSYDTKLENAYKKYN